MARLPKREQGERYRTGLTKLKIVEFVYNNVNGVPTSKISDYLDTEMNVRETKGVREHLKSLEKKHYIKGKHDPGRESYWSPPDGTDHIPELLADSDLWGSFRISGKPADDVITWWEETCDCLIRLFNTQYFVKSVKPHLIEKLFSSPPLLEEFNSIHQITLLHADRTKHDKNALLDLYDQVLSHSPTVMIHMYQPSPLIKAGLLSIQLNSKIYAQAADMALSGGSEQYPFVRDQVDVVQELIQSWKEADHVPGDVITSVEAFALASIYIGMSIDIVQFPHLSEKNNLILSDLKNNKIIARYLTNPFFSIEFMKFFITFVAVWGTFSSLEDNTSRQST